MIITNVISMIRIMYYSFLYRIHLAIRYLHDKTYQKGGWYKKWNDKSYSSSVHKATLTAFTISFVFFTMAQSLFPTLFNPALPEAALANYQSWSNRGEFLSGTRSSVAVNGTEDGQDASVTLYENQIDTDYGFNLGIKELDESSTTAINITETTDTAFYSGLSNGYITKRTAISSGDIGIETSFAGGGAFNTGGGVINDIDLTSTHLFYATTYLNNQWRVGKITQSTGVPDTGFGTNGVLDINPSSGTDTLYAIALDTNYIYLVGNDFTPGNNQWRVEKRSITTGELEPAFGTNGVLTTNPSTGSDNLRAITIDSTYMYLAGSDFLPGNNEWRIEKRTLETGALETTFDGDGIITVNPSSASDLVINDCLIVENGYLWVMGVDAGPGNGQWHLEKRNAATGALDTNFDGDGVYTYNPSSTSETLNAASIYDGYIYLGGFDHSLGASNSVWRVEKRQVSDGALDTNFGTGGILTVNYTTGHDRINDLEAKRDGLYLSGYTNTIGHYSVRDRTTGGAVTLAGISSNPTDSTDRFYDVVTQGDFMYAVGYINSGAWRIEKRYIATGGLDSNFGTGGIKTVDFGASIDVANAVAVDNDSIYVAGYDTMNGSGNSQWRVERYFLNDGSNSWTYTANPSSTADVIEGIQLSGSYLYLFGIDNSAGNQQGRIERLIASNGILDSAFGDSGIVTSNPTPGSDSFTGGIVEGDYIYAYGSDSGPGTNNTQLRIEKRQKDSGALIWTYNSNPSSRNDYINSITFLNNILYVGCGEDINLVWRVEAVDAMVGSLRTDFGTGGVIRQDGSVLDAVNDVKNDGTYLYFTGQLSDADGSRAIRIEKRNPGDGSYVTSFGAGGYLHINSSPSTDVGMSLSLTSTHIVVAGYDSIAGTNANALHLEKVSKNYSSQGGDSGFATLGTITGLKINAGNNIKPWWKNIFWNGDVPAGTTITFATRGADTEGGLASAEWSDFSTGASLLTPATQWLEIQIKLTTSNTTITPRLDDFTVNYDIPEINPSDMFVEFNGSEIIPGGYINNMDVNIGVKNLSCLTDINTCYIEVEKNSVDTEFDGEGTEQSQTKATGETAIIATTAGRSQRPQIWRARLRDINGRVGSWVTYNSGGVAWNNDFRDPHGSLSIENDAVYTKGTQVHVNLSAQDAGGAALSKMRFSNNGIDWIDWADYSNEPQLWTLESGSGQKNVYAQYQDGAGNISGARWSSVDDFINNASTTGEAVALTDVVVGETFPVAGDCLTCFASVSGSASQARIGGEGSVGLRFAAMGKQHWFNLTATTTGLSGNQYLKFAVRLSDDGLNWGDYLGRDGESINWSDNYLGAFGDEEGYYDLSAIPDAKYLDIAVMMEQSVSLRMVEINSAAVASIELDSILPETDFVATNRYPNENWSIREFSNNTELHFDTNKKTLAYVDYGIENATENVGGDPIFATSHNIILKPLKPDTTYKYIIRLIDEKNNVVKYPSSGYYTFSTEGVNTGFEGGPLVSDLSQVDITASKVKITWRTKSPSTSLVDYGFDTSYGQVAGDNVLTSDHLIELENLTAGKIYHYRVRSVDINGNEFLSGDYTFKALMKPEISDVSISNITTTSAEVSWKTNIKTNSIVNYSSALPYNRKEQKDDMVTTHNIKLTLLEDGSLYNFQIEAADELGNVTKTENKTFNTKLDTTGPKITNVRVDVVPLENEKSNSQVIISWVTDESATTFVQYGQGLIGGEYSNASIENTSLNLTHVVILKDLNTATTYHYRVVSKDKRNNISESVDFNFITPTRDKSIWQIVIRSLEETFSWTKNINIFWSNIGKRITGTR